MIHYHGTPLTPRSELRKMAGKHFCVSFAHPADADWCLTHGQSVMWDNGAFSAYTKGTFGSPPNSNLLAEWALQFAEWAGPRLGHPHWAVIPDVIDGDIAAQKSLLAVWPHSREVSAPVWHLHLPIDWLKKLADDYPKVCFGSSGAYWQVGSEAWERRVDAAFNALERSGRRPWVHMLRGLAMAGERWPFASADSVNVARNFKDQRTCPERMARRIDAVQCPVRWHVRATTADMFTEDT